MGLIILLLCALPLFAQLPDPRLTPGAVLKVSVDEVCRPGYAKKARHVSVSTKRYVFRLYGMRYQPKRAEMDHLIAICLAGDNSIRNLFPEAYDLNVGGFQMGAHEKDKAEIATHRAVCSGRISLGDAQRQIAEDWTVLYRRFVSPRFPKYNQASPGNVSVQWLEYGRHAKDPS